MQIVAKAQTEEAVDFEDSVLLVKVEADPRLDILGKKLAEYNAAKARATTTASGGKIVAGRTQGYRLMVVNSSDRTYALQVRAYLLKQYSPQHAVHMTFVNPYIKLKFGDFIDRSAAVNMRKQLMSSGVVKGNIYIVPEQVVVKRTKAEEVEDDN